MTHPMNRTNLFFSKSPEKNSFSGKIILGGPGADSQAGTNNSNSGVVKVCKLDKQKSPDNILLSD